MDGGIYRIRCAETGHVYIGSAKGIEYRFYVHLGALRKGTHINRHLQNAFNKYGESSFVFEVVEVLGDEMSYDKIKYFERENYYIDEARKTEKCYNIAKAEGGWTHSTFERLEEIGENISLGLKKYHQSLTKEELNAKYGHRRDVPMSEAQKQHLSDYWKGKPKSEETKKRMSEAQKGAEHCKITGKLHGSKNLNVKGGIPANSKITVIDGITYPSVKHAAKALNINYFKLLAQLYPDKYKIHKSKCVKIKIGDQIFKSKTEAAEQLNRSITWVTSHSEIIND